MVSRKLFENNYKITRGHKARCNKGRVKLGNKVYNPFKRI